GDPRSSDLDMPFHQLELLNTPEAAREEVRRYLASTSNDNFHYIDLLLKSSRLDAIIFLLREAVSNPNIVLPDGIVSVLAGLQTRKDLGEAPSFSGPNSESEEVRQIRQRRLEAEAKYRDLYRQELLDTKSARWGPGRTQVAFLVWEDRVDTASISLRYEVLDRLRDLPFQEQLVFLNAEWSRRPHAQLHSAVRSLALEKSADSGIRDGALKWWCEDWPRECGAALLDEARQPQIDIDAQTILLMRQAELPEFDGLLRERLNDSKTVESKIGALLLRVAGKNILPAAEAFLDRHPASFDNCREVGYVTGYLFRVSASDAAKRLSQLLNNRDCGFQVLQLWHNSGFFPPAAFQVIAAALQSPDYQTAGAAALFLSEHGDASAKPVILKRLRQLQSENQERAKEIRSTWMDNQTAGALANFEATLVSAIVNAQQWKVSEDEQKRIGEACLSEMCEQALDGRGARSL
ncbi:MAG: hypothetical protein WB992_24945, partial [Bryobacteraceae bacterium]